MKSVASNTRRRPWSGCRSASAGLLALAILLCAPFGRVGLAEDNPPEISIEEDSSPEVSRDAWRQRIQDARRRAREIAIDRRNHPELYLPPPPPDPEIEATERVLKDESLQPGDIVATKKGLFVFKGRGDQQRREDDFVRIPSR